MKRKDFLKTMAFGAVSGTVLLSACGGDNTNKNQPAATTPTEPAAPAVASADCNDLSALTDAEKKQRESVSYVTVSADPEKKCGNCRFYQAPAAEGECGHCQLFKGPVVPEGNCKSWFKKDAA